MYELVRSAVLAALLAAGGLAVPASVPASAAPCGRAAADKAGRWYAARVPLPPHSAAHQAVHGDLRRLRAVAVDPADARVVLATDGERVQRSDDGGCSWREVWRVPGRADPAADPAAVLSTDPTAPAADLDAIAALDVTHAGGRTRVLLAVERGGWGPRVGGRTFLYRSPDGRTGWASAGDASLLTGVADPMAGASPPVLHSAGAVAYAAVTGPAGTVTYVRSADGGATWERRSPPVAPDDPVAIVGFAVNPWSPDELWEWGGTQSRSRGALTGLRRSTDGARTWTPVDPWPFFGPNPPTWHSVDVWWPRRGAPARLLAVGATRDPTTTDGPPTLSWSGDGGRTFAQVIPPGRTSVVDAALAHTARGDVVIATASGATYLVPYRGRPPRPPDWRALPPLPVKPDGEWTAMGYDRARATATPTPVVAVPTWTSVLLLAVRR